MRLGGGSVWAESVAQFGAEYAIKLLLWEGDGFAVYYKRLEKGTYELPAFDGKNESLSITAQQLQFILQGISLKSIRRRPRYQHLAPESG